MMDRELEQKLAQALNHAAPDDLNDVLSRCGTEERTVMEMENAVSSRKKKRWGWLAAVLALTLIAGGGSLFYQYTYAVASVISLDVNPSIELRVNSSKTVLSCTAMNEDAAVILSDMGSGADLEGTKLEVAVNAIVGALLRNGYLDSISSAILISVEDNDQNRAERIQEELVAVVNSVFQGNSERPSIYSQNLTVDAGLAIQAQSGNISPGKAYLVNQVIDLNNSLEFDALAALSVEELQDLIQIGAPGMPIGMDTAKWAAEDYAGTLVLSSDVVQDVDPDLDDRVPHYEVELYVPGLGEFEYEIDAFTGAVLSGQKDIMAASQSTVSDNSTGSNPGASNPQPPSNGNVAENANDIGTEAAKSAALNHAGLSESQVSRLKVERDWDDGRLQYEVEFFYNDTEYEYTIDGVTGDVRGYEAEPVRGGQTQAPAGGGAATTDIGADAAKTAALNHAGVSEAQVTDLRIKQDNDDGLLEYDIDFVYNSTKYEYTIDGTTGAVIGYEVESDHHGKTQIPASDTIISTDIGTNAAKAAALNHAGLSESQVSHLEVERDWDDGHLEYEVEFKFNGYEYEYTINGATGTILEYEVDWDD